MQGLVKIHFFHAPLLCPEPLRGQQVYVRGGTLATSVVIEHVVGDAEEPRAESGLPLELRDIEICLDESVLRQVIAQLRVSTRLVEEKPADGFLVPLDQRVEGTPVV